MTVEHQANRIIFNLEQNEEEAAIWIEKRYGVDHFALYLRDFLHRKMEEKRLDAMEHVKQLLSDDDMIKLLRSKGVDL